MQSVITQYVNSLEVVAGIHFEAMTLFPLLSQSISPLRYRVLAEALADGSVEVREKPSATVPELWLINHSADPVFVIGGEEVVGGKQNRMVNASFLIAPHRELNLPVTCVEHGRWHRTSEYFAGGETVYFELRREASHQVHKSLRLHSLPRADQAEVWDSIALRSSELGASSPTGAMHDIYRTHAASLADYEHAFPPVSSAVGMAVFIGGQLAGLDAFDQTATAYRLWPRLVRSYALDALRVPAGATEDSAKAVSRFLKEVGEAQAEIFPSLDLGNDLRLESKTLDGAALVYREIVIHLVAFPKEHDTQQSARSSLYLAHASERRRRRWQDETRCPRD